MASLREGVRSSSARVAVCAAALALASQAFAADKPRPEPRAQAPAATHFGTPASYRAPAAPPAFGRGYSARARHMADCLATFPGYDPRTDRVAVRPGVSRRCAL